MSTRLTISPTLRGAERGLLRLRTYGRLSRAHSKSPVFIRLSESTSGDGKDQSEARRIFNNPPPTALVECDTPSSPRKHSSNSPRNRKLFVDPSFPSPKGKGRGDEGISESDLLLRGQMGGGNGKSNI
ncbi:hypothetical protein TNCV_1070481 [Trichonephila clavipes]|nr:hypothetical protein TNCV_1070481 [Trichonephila clavipes]